MHREKEERAVQRGHRGLTRRIQLVDEQQRNVQKNHVGLEATSSFDERAAIFDRSDDVARGFH